MSSAGNAPPRRRGARSVTIVVLVGLILGAVALTARGLEAPDTSGIDSAVLQRLSDGPAEENRRAGGVLAHWLVAHAEDLDVQYVIFDDLFWSARLAAARWHPYDSPDPDNEILRHLDHVHVDVLRGGGG